ncbi:MAG: GNAT family protein [candidate division Zixibacteria bacterium]|nr:GNAT family protein [candidate division Zixibacteria bacterium]
MHLETERLLLTPHTLANVECMHLWENDADLLYYNDNQPEDREPDTLEDIQQYLTEIMQDNPVPKTIYYAVHKKANQQLIGYGMIALIDRYNHQCKLGIVIGEKQEWGQGYAKEVLQAVITYCFTTLDMNRIGAECYAINERSIRLIEHLGFKREGVVRESVLKKGEFADEYIYGLLRREWNEQRSRA